MGKIFVLDEILANKIAAGEVVERPAAVIKELVENAIDAGATRIDISIAGGGLEIMRVVDNGSGMAQEDVPLALQRHATSKIRDASDLAAIITLGFRGEALPSIASVSRLRIVTRRAEDLAGTVADIHSGKLLNLGEAGCPVGTEVRVENLFYNTPARLKFLKSEGAETARVTDTVQRLVLAWPEISFSYTVNGKEQLVTTGSGVLEDVVHQVLGKISARQMVPLAWKGSLLAVEGFVSKPSLARANRNLQFFFVNKRPVRSPLLSDALQTAYHTLLPRNRFPAAVVFIHVNPGDVDVNVHPAKREIRFSQERDVYRQFLTGVKSALRESSLIGDVYSAAVSTVRETAATISFGEYAQKLPGTAFTLDSAMEQEVVSQNSEPASSQAVKCVFPYLRPIGQHLASYILAQADSGELYIVDQHAAHERILYDTFKRDLAAGDIPVQEVLPQNFELDAAEAVGLTNSLKLFAQLGLTFEPFGNNTFILRTVPLFFRQCLNQDDIMEFVTAAVHQGETTALFEKALQMMACKAAVKANHAMSKEEMAALLRNLAETDQPNTCPHGRPTVLVFSKDLLARNFRRQ
ncbi:MAG: DNA mismatch repair endonuclease MutL [Clostridiales bacterium]|jgi:DNA mismatch repair protein MutL|nr:DNA mismatch repair endonuclease MutL [Clostridiales bacterium]